MAWNKALWTVLLPCVLFDVSHAVDPYLGKYTDVIFVLHETLDMDGVNFALVKQFQIAVVNEYRSQLKVNYPENAVRFSDLVFSNYEKVQFGYDAGHNLANGQAIIDAIDKTDYMPAAISNLCGALQKTVRIIADESGPSRNEVVIILAKCDNDVAQEDIDETVRELRENHTSVFVIDIAETLSKRDVQRRALAQSNINALTGGKPEYHITVPTYMSLLTQLEAIMKAIWTYTYQKVCDITTSPCNRSCGVGWMTVHSECNVYVGDPPMEFSNQVCDYKARCCKAPCNVGGGPPEFQMWHCRFLAPYNGLEI